MLSCLFLFPLLFAKEPPPQVIVWPTEGSPVIRFTFGKFKGLSSYDKEHNYSVETTAENLWGKRIESASFSLYLFDKNKVRIGEGWISLSNVRIGETVRFQTTLGASGNPVSLSLSPRSLPSALASYLPAKLVSVTVNSIPQAAMLSVDGKEIGLTPKLIEVGSGHHLLQFKKEGFNTGQFPLEISNSDASGGSVSFELGTAAHDTLELRDGSVLTGDIESMSGSEIVVRAGGTLQNLRRNQVKRILLVEREIPGQ
jgi:PEGA domain